MKTKTSYRGRASRGAVAVFVSIILSAGVSYLLRMYLARVLGPEKFGIFFAVLTFITIITLFRDFGLNLALVKFIPEFQVKKQFNKIRTAIVSVLSVQIAIALIMFAAIFHLSDFLAQNYFHNPTTGLILKLLSITFVFLVFDDLIKKIFQGLQKMSYFAGMEFARNLLTLILIVALFTLGFDIYAPVYAYVLVNPIIALSFFPILLHYFNIFKYKGGFSKPTYMLIGNNLLPNSGANLLVFK